MVNGKISTLYSLLSTLYSIVSTLNFLLVTYAPTDQLLLVYIPLEFKLSGGIDWYLSGDLNYSK